MLTLITPDFIKKYTEKGYRHKAYADTVKITKEIRFHSDGEAYGDLISERRPNESEETKKYREKIAVAITEGVFGKVVTSLSKIRKSQDWSVSYDEVSNAKIKEGESLQDYCEENYPYFSSITNWVFDVCLKNYLTDPNALLCVMPLDFNPDVNEFKKPFGVIFGSENILDFVQDDYCVIKSTDKSTYTDGGATFDNGDIYYVFTTLQILKFEQIKADKTLQITVEYNHEIGLLPCFKLGGIFKEAKDTTFIYKSRISAMIPRLNEAVREYSDMQAEVVQHVHSEKWMIASQDCQTCSGTGYVLNGNTGKKNKCSTCKGLGLSSNSPYNHIVVNPKALPGQSQPIIPPGGFITKQIDIVKIQDERIDKHIYSALSVINMEFLAQTPLSQSGTAKEIDKDELNNFVHSVAENIVSIMDKIYFLVNEYRYSTIIPDKKARLELLPDINVPDRFDLLNPAYLVDEIDKAKKSGMNTSIITGLEVDYITKKFSANDENASCLKLIISLDPLSGIGSDIKLMMLQNSGISKQDYVVSCNIDTFVRRAIFENKDFEDMMQDKQYDIIAKYADDKINSMSAKAAVINAM